MKTALLNKIIKPHATPWRVAVSVFGLAVGLAGMLLAVQLYYDFDNLFSQGEKTESDHDYLVISKVVAMDNTFSLSPPAFSKPELEEIETQPFVMECAGITGSTFRITMSPIGPLKLYTELFLEAVPTEMIDNPPEEWGWKQGDDTIPALLSNEFLNLYNFVFAPSQGLPPLTRDALKMLSIPLSVGKLEQGGQIVIRIVGFSDRITSVLVPQPFLSWANKKYGTRANPMPSRIIIKVRDASDPAIVTYLKEKGYETNQDRLRRSRTAAAARFAVAITALVSLIVAGLSVLIGAMSTQLLISRSAAALGLLSDLGYPRNTLIRWLLVKHIIALGLVVVLSGFVFLYSHSQILDLFRANGFFPPTGISPHLYWVVPLFVMAELVLQLMSISLSLEMAGNRKAVQ